MWEAVLVFGMISLRAAIFAAGPHPFPYQQACQDYLDDLVSTVNAANSRRPENMKVMMAGNCLVKDLEL